MEANQTLCPFCGQPSYAEVFEAWEHDFMIETCCEASHDQLCDQTPDEWRVTLKAMHIEGLLNRRLRRVSPIDGHLLLDFRLEVRPIKFADARAFVARHHRHSPAPIGWRFGGGLWNGPTLIGVCIVGRPVARMLNPATTLEVTRLCIDHRLPAPLTEHACSMAYAWAAREGRKLGHQAILTYTLATESGLSLIAAG